MTPELHPPGDKSITHRALLIGAMAHGTSRVEHPLTALDARSMAGALRRLGAEVSPLRGDAVRLRGVGRRFREPGRALHLGNSGTAVRLLLGAVAGCDITVRLTGDASLRRRPMRRVTEPLRTMGLTILDAHNDGLPVTVRGGALTDFRYTSPVASAQLKSALLLAGLSGRVAVTVTEPYRSRDHTERLLRALGIDVAVQGTTVTLDHEGAIPSFSTRVPGDPSSAAFLIGAAALARRPVRVRGVGLNPLRIEYLGILTRMGVTVTANQQDEWMGEPVGTLTVGSGELRGTEVAAGEIPGVIDEIPLLAVVAARAEGETVFRGAGELRVKESDRLALIARNLRTIGTEAEVVGDDLVVRGAHKPLHGVVETGWDHRIAMAFAVLGAARGVMVQLSERESPAVSYPTFFADLSHTLGHD